VLSVFVVADLPTHTQTTLLNHLLKERGATERFKSIAVIENEFGEVNIDRELGESCMTVVLQYVQAPLKVDEHIMLQLRITC
jgi:hypothetical protein